MQTLLFVLRAVTYGGILALRDFLKLIYELLTRWCRGKGKSPTPRRCVPINDPAFVRPDPMIYDQYYLASLGLAVTWDNPDIQLYLNGSPVLSSQLIAETTYEVAAQIWNNSTDAPVVGMPVAFSFLEFGVGTVSVPIGITQIDLGVKGGSYCPAYAKMLWTTPAAPGHYCLQVQLQPVDDTNTLNNLGQENTDVAVAHSPAAFTFTLRNNTDQPRTYRFEIDAYVPGTPDPCNGTGNPGKDRGARMARHKSGVQPVPAGWQVKIDPAGPSLAPGQSIPITVSATPPPGFVGEQPLNVNAFHQKGFAGGVTLNVKAP